MRVQRRKLLLRSFTMNKRTIKKFAGQSAGTFPLELSPIAKGEAFVAHGLHGIDPSGPLFADQAEARRAGFYKNFSGFGGLQKVNRLPTGWRGEKIKTLKRISRQEKERKGFERNEKKKKKKVIKVRAYEHMLKDT